MPTARESAIWSNIRRQLSGVQQMIMNGQYADAAITDKNILQVLVRMQIDKAVLVSNTLENDIGQLYDNRIISKYSFDNYQTICAIGMQAENTMNASVQDANESFNLMKTELNTYIENNQPRQVSEPAGPDESYHAEYTPAYSEESPVSYQSAAQPSSGPEIDIPLPPRNTSRRNVDTDRASSQRPARPLKDSERVSRNGVRRSGSGRSGGKRAARYGQRRERGFEFNIYTVLKFLIPVICIVLFIILVRILLSNGKPPVETTTAAPETKPIVTQAAIPETKAPETTAPTQPPVSTDWVITNQNVRVRTAPSTTDSEVITTLDKNTHVVFKGDYSEEWIVIDYKGKDAYVSRQFAKPAE